MEVAAVRGRLVRLEEAAGEEVEPVPMEQPTMVAAVEEQKVEMVE